MSHSFVKHLHQSKNKNLHTIRLSKQNNATSQGLAQAISIDDKENKCISFDSEVFYKHTRKIYTNESENFRERGRKNTLVNGYEHDIYCLIDRYDTFDFGVSVSSSAKE